MGLGLVVFIYRERFLNSVRPAPVGEVSVSFNLCERFRWPCARWPPGRRAGSPRNVRPVGLGLVAFIYRERFLNSVRPAGEVNVSFNLCERFR